MDVVVIGAGLAGLVCAQQLQQSGYQVMVIEKSRGVGGRLATRRLHGTCADHGVRYLANQGPLTACLIQTLQQQNLVHLWTDTFQTLQANQLQIDKAHTDNTHTNRHTTEVSPYYTATAGLTSAAKFLASNLNIWQGQRVQALLPMKDRWQIVLEATAEPILPLTARSVVIAIPAPQALALVQPLLKYGAPTELVQTIASVEFDSCYSVIAAYSPEQHSAMMQLPWHALSFDRSINSDLAWISLESKKRPDAKQPVLVAQSTAAFAQSHLEAEDLKPIGQHLLGQAATLAPWLAAPTDLQVHRWRYAFVRQPLQQLYLTTNRPLPLVCSGDWCGGRQIENALESGLAAACQISSSLNNRASADAIWNAHSQELFHQLTASLT